jgi:hypothetical protein
MICVTSKKKWHGLLKCPLSVCHINSLPKQDVARRSLPPYHSSLSPSLSCSRLVFLSLRERQGSAATRQGTRNSTSAPLPCLPALCPALHHTTTTADPVWSSPARSATKQTSPARAPSERRGGGAGVGTAGRIASAACALPCPARGIGGRAISQQAQEEEEEEGEIRVPAGGGLREIDRATGLGPGAVVDGDGARRVGGRARGGELLRGVPRARVPQEERAQHLLPRLLRQHLPALRPRAPPPPAPPGECESRRRPPPRPASPLPSSGGLPLSLPGCHGVAWHAPGRAICSVSTPASFAAILAAAVPLRSASCCCWMNTPPPHRHRHRGAAFWGLLLVASVLVQRMGTAGTSTNQSISLFDLIVYLLFLGVYSTRRYFFLYTTTRVVLQV